MSYDQFERCIMCADTDICHIIDDLRNVLSDIRDAYNNNELSRDQYYELHDLACDRMESLASQLNQLASSGF